MYNKSMLIYSYIEQLERKRATNPKDWYKVGFVLYRQTKGSEEGLKVWHNFSKWDQKNYNKKYVQKTWDSFKDACYCINLRSIAQMVIKDGGTIYNPNHGLFVEDEKKRNHIFNNIVPKLSIKRIRSFRLLDDLCSAMYHMCNHESLDDLCTDLSHDGCNHKLGKEAMLKVSKRIKDPLKKAYFISRWENVKFAGYYGMSSIMNWYGNDQHNKMLNRLKRE